MAVASSTPAAASGEGPAQRRALTDTLKSWGRRFLMLREGSIIVITLVTAIYFATQTGRFLTLDSFKTLLPYFAPIAIFAAGEVFVMINGEIDLSIGAMYLFIPFWFDKINGWGIPLIPALILALLSAVALGAVNGFAVAYVGINSFVATLGMLFFLSGLTLVISHATPITPPGTSITSTTSFETVFGHGTYSELIWAVVIVAVLQVILSLARWGIYTVSTGSNRNAAAEAGIRWRVNIMGNFMVCGLLAAFVGILETTRATSATPDPSGPNALLFQAVSAAVIGGTLLQGGSGTVVGALIGALFLGILNDGLTLTGVSANYLNLYLGIAIILAMAANTYVARARTRAGGG